MKRVFLLLVCVALCLCGLTCAQAGDNAVLKLESSTTSAYGGDEITISLRMTADNMGGLQTSLTWDTAYAIYVEGSATFSTAFKASAMIAQANARDGNISLLYASTTGYDAKDEVVFTAKFRLAEQAYGYADFALSGTKMTDASASVNAMSDSVQGVSVYTQVYHPGEAFVSIYSEDHTPIVGEVVAVRVDMWSYNAEIGSVQGQITYDPSVMELVKGSVKFKEAASAVAYVKNLNVSEAGTIQFVYATMEGVTRLELLEAQFRVVGAQDTSIIVDNIIATNADTDRLAAMECVESGVWFEPWVDDSAAVYILQPASAISCSEEVVTIVLSERGAPIGGMQGTLTYDASQMEYIAGSAAFVDGFAAGADIKMINDTKVGQIKLVYVNTQGYSPQGAAILTLQFRLKGQETLTPVILTNLKTTAPGVNGAKETISAFIQDVNWEAGLHTIVVDAAVAATCTTSGKTEGKHCSVCNTVLTAQTTIPAKGHTEVVDAAVAATCTTTGKTEGKHCSVCNTVLTAQTTIPAKGHTEVVDKAVAATCTTVGKTQGKHCSVCNAVLTAQTTIPAKGHTEVVDKAIAATCTTSGKTEGKHCSVCNAVLTAQMVIPATGHIWDDGVFTVISCVSNEKRFTCTQCDTVQFESYEGTGAHKWDDGTVISESNCAVMGEIRYVCQECTGYRVETLPYAEHTVVIDAAVKPTCTTAGKTQGKHCSVCNVVLTAQTTVPAKGHTWNAGVVTQKPTTTAEGILTYTCTVCKGTKTERLPVRVPGDANADGKVNLDDALLVFDYGSGKNVSINLYNADVNQDGIVDAQDALLIMQYLSGWDVKLK